MNGSIPHLADLWLAWNNAATHPTLTNMKRTLALSTFFCLCASSAFAGFSERKLEAAKKSAAKSGKKIAFVFYQDFYNPNCPKCIQEVSAANNAVTKSIPRTSLYRRL